MTKGYGALTPLPTRRTIGPTPPESEEDPVNRLLAIALAAAPLLAVATPAAAAPPQRIVESECFDGGGDSVICYNVKRMVKTTTRLAGTESFMPPSIIQ
jgi:hypothetical protein